MGRGVQWLDHCQVNSTKLWQGVTPKLLTLIIGRVGDLIAIGVIGRCSYRMYYVQGCIQV